MATTAPTTTAEGTTTDGGTEGESSVSVTGTGESGSSDTGTRACDDLPAAPVAFELATDELDGSDDIAFDGAGWLYGKQGDAIVRIDAGGVVEPYADLAGLGYGLRFRSDGELLVAMWTQDRVVRVTPAGQVFDFITPIDLPNGIHVDSEDRAWIGDIATARILRAATDGTTTDVITGAGASSVGGIVLDEARSLLWFTQYEAGQIRNAPIDAGGNAGEVAIVTTLPGRPNGLALDVCGHLYIADHLNDDVYRLQLDDGGVPLGDPELLAELPTFVYNLAFGRGDGWSETSLYAASAAGSVWALDVGVMGVPLPP
jgi:sugar lactone lactonase YvrE